MVLKKSFDVCHSYQQLKLAGDVVFSYKGRLSNSLMDEILSYTYDRVNEYEPESRVVRKVNMIAVEVLQNVLHHYSVYEQSSGQEGKAIFALKQLDEGYQIYSANYLCKDKVGELEQWIHYVNSLSSLELKKVYRDLLLEEFSQSIGSKLGILDIVRKSGQPLDYTMTPMGEQSVFFELRVVIR